MNKQYSKSNIYIEKEKKVPVLPGTGALKYSLHPAGGLAI